MQTQALTSLRNQLIAKSNSYACEVILFNDRDIITASDGSAMLQLAITFTGDDACDNAETFAKYAALTITEFIAYQLANFSTAHIESHEFYTQQLIHGYAYYKPKTHTAQISHYASIIYTDCTIYVNLTIYPQ